MFRDLAESLAGAWAIMLGRAEGLGRLDLSLEGFWRSFGAIVLLLPFSILILISGRRYMAETGAMSALGGDWLGPGLVALVADWCSFPLVFAAMAKPLGLASRYVPFIVSRNWAAVIIAAMISVIHALYLLALLPSALTSVLLLAGMAVTLWFSYVIVRTTLQVGIGMALPIVLLDFLMSFVIWTGFERLAYG